jgi:hypothetical protein
MGANAAGSAGAVQTAQTAHGAHCGAGGVMTAAAGGGAGVGTDAQVASSTAAMDEKNKFAAREDLVMLKNFIVSRVYNCRLAITI